MADTDQILGLMAEIESKTQEPELTIPEKIMGYSRSYLAGPTFNFADNIEAGAASLFSPLSYDEELANIRQEQNRFKRNTDYLDNIVEIGSGAILNPLGALGKTAQGAKGGLTTATRALTNEATQGALSSIGMAEEGDDLVKAGLFGAALGKAGQVAATGAGSLLQGAAKEADRLKLSAYGVNFGAIQKELKKMAGKGIDEIDEIPLLSTVDKFEGKRIINAESDALENFGRVLSHQSDLSGELDGVLKQVDEVLPGSRDFRLDNTIKYIDSLSGTARDTADQAAMDELSAITKQLGSGKLSDLQKAKIGLNYKWDQNPERESIIKAMRSDLRQEIEDRVNLAAQSKFISPQLHGSVRALNGEWGEAAQLKDVFTRQLAKDYGGDFVEDAFNSIRTSGGVGTLINASAGTKNPIYAALGILGTAARSNENKSKIADTLREFKKPIGAAGDFLVGDTLPGPNLPNFGGKFSLSDKGGKLPAPITARTTTQLYDAFNSDSKPVQPTKATTPKNFARIESLLSEIEKKTSGKSEATFENQSLFSPKGGDMAVDEAKQPVAYVEEQIDKDPYFSTLYEFESNRDPKAVPKDKKTGKLLSTAKGGFQFLDATAKSMGLDDPFDLGKSYDAVQKLDSQSAELHENDPILRYSAHYLGETVLRKVLNGQPLKEKEQEQVKYLRETLIPRFEKMYAKNSQKIASKASKVA